MAIFSSCGIFLDSSQVNERKMEKIYRKSDEIAYLARRGGQVRSDSEGPRSAANFSEIRCLSFFYQELGAGSCRNLITRHVSTSFQFVNFE
jgi:hypothetical protein